MLENFRYQAKRSVVHAQEAARVFGHDSISTEHLVLGMLREPDSPAAAALSEAGLTDQMVSDHIEDVFGRGEPRAPEASVPFDLEAKSALDAAEEEAAALGKHSVGAEHLLLAIMREREGGAVRMMEKLGVDPEAIRPAVMRQLPPPEQEPGRRQAGKELGQILVDQGVISEEQLAEALEGARDKLLGRALIDMGLIKERDLVEALATQIGLDFVDLDRFPIEAWSVQLVPPAVAWRHHCIAIGERDGDLLVAMSNPADTHAIDDIRVIANRRVRPVVAMASDIERAIRAHLGPRDQAEGTELPVTSRTWADPAAGVMPAEPWRGPDDRVIGVPVDLAPVLAVTDTGVFVAVSNVVAHPSGFQITVTLRRSAAPRSDKWFEAVSWQHRWQGSGIPELSPRALRVGIEFPDGARVDNLSFRDVPSRRPPPPCMIAMGAEGSAWRVDAHYWIWPLPPPGATSTFFCEWPSEGVALSRVEFDGSLLHEAASRAQILWDEAGNA